MLCIALKQLPANADYNSQSEAAHLLLNSLLKKANLPTEVQKDENGRPFCAYGNVDISLAHTKGLALAALLLSEKETAEKPRIGIDAEVPGRKREPALAARFFASCELAYYQAAKNPSLAFTEIFTAKEAYAKYRGTGLAKHGKEDVFSPSFLAENRIKFRRMRYADCVITLCLPKDCTEEPLITEFKT